MQRIGAFFLYTRGIHVARFDCLHKVNIEMNQ